MHVSVCQSALLLPFLHCPCSELIRKFTELKQRHEKVYRLYKYQEKLIADLEEVCACAWEGVPIGGGSTVQV